MEGVTKSELSQNATLGPWNQIITIIGNHLKRSTFQLEGNTSSELVEEVQKPAKTPMNHHGADMQLGVLTCFMFAIMFSLDQQPP